jgi:AAHS family 4-hydroxybenzoate transporter-like MFS transporter
MKPDKSLSTGKYQGESQPAVRQWQVALLCSLVAVCDGFDTQAIAFVAPVISKQWGVAANQFGIVFSAGLLGLALGAFSFGSIADRVGRKSVIIMCVSLFGLTSILTSRSTGMTELACWRLLTGLGLGGVLPNLIALTNEVASERTKNSLVMTMFCGFPLGATIGGLVSVPLIDSAGWQGVFLVGGILPLILLPMLAWFLPGTIETSKPAATADAGASARGHALLLFAGGRAIPTMLLWAAFFCNLLVMYFMVNWLPSLLSLTGTSLSVSTLSTAVLNLAGIAGALAFSRYVDGKNALMLLGGGYIVGAAALFLIGHADGNTTVIFGAAALAGAVIVGGQIAMNAVAASFYPANIRATGVGWALGIGRVGSVIGPMVGGILLKSGWQGTTPVMFAALPLLVAATAAFCLIRFMSRHAGQLADA